MSTTVTETTMPGRVEREGESAAAAAATAAAAAPSALISMTDIWRT